MTPMPSPTFMRSNGALNFGRTLIDGMTIDPSSDVVGNSGGLSPERDNPHAQNQNFQTFALTEILYDLTTVGLLGTLAAFSLWLSAR